MTDGKLSFGDSLYNTCEGLALPFRLLTRWQFRRAVGAKLHCIHTQADRRAPAGITILWDQYGISSCLGGGVRSPDAWEVWWYVSACQAWMADRTARADGWIVLSPPVVDRRGSSAADAEKGLWKASGRERRAVGYDGVIMRGIGNLLGVRQSVRRRVLEAPGLRQAKPAMRRAWWKFWRV